MLDPKHHLREAVEQDQVYPFVCAYPPRSAYVPNERPLDINQVWRKDLEVSGPDLNLYIHVPFCAYRCGFCNLYTVKTNGDLHDAYVEAVCSHLRSMSEVIQSRRILTLYVGGGTPTVLSISQLSLIFKTLDLISPSWRSTVEEVALEASPDSVTGQGGLEYVLGLCGLGFNRLNLGVQSLVAAELKEAGRARAGIEKIEAAIAAVKAGGIRNLSTDLIIGFAAQTDLAWQHSVAALIALRPETISTYFLSVRPDAWFGRLGRYPKEKNPTLYRRYDIAREVILGAGYSQDSNVRFSQPGRGGYKQKELQFRGVPVLGVGAGARSYNATCDYVTGGADSPDIGQIRKYIQECTDGPPPARAGFLFDEEERVRKRFALGLNGLPIVDLLEMKSAGSQHVYERPLSAAMDLGLVKAQGEKLVFTSRGFRHSDAISWMFFSPKVISRYRGFYEALEGRVTSALPSRTEQFSAQGVGGIAN